MNQNEDQYDFSHKRRGYMVIIVNEEFKYNNSGKRLGADVDLAKIRSIADKLGFEVFNDGKERNLDKSETLRILRRAQEADHSDADCFAVCISTHGDEVRDARIGGKLDHVLLTADSQVIFTRNIVEMFDDRNCPGLKDKPKLFFIQACRGNNVDEGGQMHVVHPKPPLFPYTKESDPLTVPKNSGDSDDVDEYANLTSPVTEGNPAIRPTASQAGEQTDSKLSFLKNVILLPFKKKKDDVISLRCHNDMLIMYAVPEGMYAFRNVETGSWMIQYLSLVIECLYLSRPVSFLTVLTRVSSLMSERETITDDEKTNQKKAIPVIEHKLTKDIFFNKK